MEVRGERRCRDCGERWSYFETGEVECPACGSVRSVGVSDERTLHTASDEALDLDAARRAAANDSLDAAARAAAEATASFVRAHGFVRAGELTPLPETYVAAQELRHAAARVDTGLDQRDDEEAYLLALLEGAEGGTRPGPGEVPVSFRGARGLAAAASVEAYRRDVIAWLRRNDASPESRAVLERLGDHRKRLAALDGELPPSDADLLVDAARALGEQLRGDAGLADGDGDTDPLADARRALDDLESSLGS